MEIRKISRRRQRFVDNAELGHLTFLFGRGRQRNCTKTYNARAQLLSRTFCLVTQFTLPSSSWFAKLPNSCACALHIFVHFSANRKWPIASHLGWIILSCKWGKLIVKRAILNWFRNKINRNGWIRKNIQNRFRLKLKISRSMKYSFELPCKPYRKILKRKSHF